MSGQPEEMFAHTAGASDARSQAHTVLERLLELEVFADLAVEKIEALAEALANAIDSGAVGDDVQVAHWRVHDLTEEQAHMVASHLGGIAPKTTPKKAPEGTTKKRSRKKAPAPANANAGAQSKSAPDVRSGHDHQEVDSMEAVEGALEAVWANVFIVDDNLDVLSVNGRCRDALEVLGSEACAQFGVSISGDVVSGSVAGFFSDEASTRRSLKRIGAYGLESSLTAAGQSVRAHLGAAVVGSNRCYLLTWSVDDGQGDAALTEASQAAPSKDASLVQSAIAASAENLLSVSQRLAFGAEETSSQANLVSAASEEVSGNLQTVASGMDELRESISEIARSASEASEVAAKGVDLAETTNRTVAKLGDSSSEIGKVIKVITTIAQQTNLLALNATIEAARAGEAGKGFAVVANEVKDLAKETATASEDISRKVEAIQTGTADAVRAISEINSIVNQINEIQLNIAAAVEEQTATAGEIGRNIGEAARGSAEITENVVSVATAARSTSEGATDTKRSAEDLNALAAQFGG